MGKSYNNSTLSSLRTCVIEAVRVTFGAAGAPTLVDAGKSQAVASVVQTATGRYTFTLNPPYGAALVAVIPELSCVAANGALLRARYVEGSISFSAGTFEIDVSDTTPVAADPTSGTAMDVILVLQRCTN